MTELSIHQLNRILANPERIGAKLASLREQAGLSKSQVGKRMGFPQKHPSSRINDIEKAIHTPSVDTLQRYCDAIDVPMSLLFTGWEGSGV